MTKMTKSTIQQAWLIVCLAIMTLVLLFTSFRFSITCKYEDNDSLRYVSFTKQEENFEFSEFCDKLNAGWERYSQETSNMVRYTIDMYGIGADSEYTPFSFAEDIVSRLLDSFRFDMSALAISPFKSIFVFTICIAFVVTTATTLIKGFIQSGAYLISGSKKNSRPPNGVAALCAPLYLWISVEIFRFYNAYSLESSFQIKSDLTTQYLSGFNFLFVFIGVMVAYWIGYAVINTVVREKKASAKAETES